MKINHTIAALQQDYHTIRVRFKLSDNTYTVKEYTYKARFDQLVSAGDQVIVDSPYGGMKVVIVTDVDDFANIDFDATYTYKWIVQKVDTSTYEDNLASEIEAGKAIRQLRNNAKRFAVREELNQLVKGPASKTLYQTILGMFGLQVADKD